MAREVPLTQGRVALVDERDYARVAEHVWTTTAQDGRAYAKRRLMVDGQAFDCYLHRFVLGLPDGVRVHFRDGDGLNCTRANLALGAKTAPYRGVSRQPATGRWTVSLRLGGVCRYLGAYDTQEEAARVYDAAVARAGVERAPRNFPEIDPAADAIAARRLAKERVPRRPKKLGEAKAAAIRARYAAGGVTMQALADEYGVHVTMVSRVVNGLAWKEAA